MPNRYQPSPEWVEWATANPCPMCGAPPVEREVNETQEHRTAPRSGGMVMLWAPFEMGDLIGMDYEETMTCQNGHKTWLGTETRFFDEPIPGLR